VLSGDGRSILSRLDILFLSRGGQLPLVKLAVLHAALPWRKACTISSSDEMQKRRSATMSTDADVIVVGAGLAGLVATAELADAGKRVVVVEQEPPQSLGGQAFWSFGGLFLVDSPEQRRLGIRDSYDLALEDWMGTAGFD